MPSLLNITLRSLPPQFAGAAAGIYSTVQQTSSALGICLIGGVFYYFIGLTKNVQLAYHYGLIIHIGCLIILSILLLCLPKTVQGPKTATVAE
ncbi:transporter [Chitinophaga pinensis DSM 2588]|uniref:Transporter n=1 Tax=Chitinophaga pinensis (strain ATCC 43595 / DSM 2588 / LMG 13176 / NBRC 15968 / NCIMB 11800 / UQM 2034) TaxID=485918 RepID=A0A979G6H2_CHIPD|nr:transporter [Chitinophaga pinensis DSM 2588]